MPIGELLLGAFLGSFLQVLFDRLASPKLLKFAGREGIDKLLKKWKQLLSSIDQVLVDAEDMQLTGDNGAKLWLEDLKDLAYDIDDLLDEFAMESAESKSKAEPSTSKARSLLPSCCFRLSPRALILDRKLRSKIKDMDDRLHEIITRKDSLSLREKNGQQPTYSRLGKPLPTTYLPEPCFVSREDEKMEIISLLIGEEDDRTCADPKVIPIVGMGGVGKTALAQQVYNDDRVTGYFEVKAWACVSDEFDVPAITRKILEATNDHSSCEGKDLNWLQDKLKDNLSGKKFLVVLDDVWNEKYGNWTILLKPLQFGAKGSKIVVTTRNLRIASIAGAPPKTLKVLSLDACMTLFAFHALGVGNFDHHPELEELGWKIVEKCQGLPLAVKTLAGMLRNEVNPHTWEAILNSKIWDLPEESNEILPALILSYLHLPSRLRRCFAYCAIFPKDYEINRNELIHWWIAEGLVVGQEGKNRWDVGLDYFNQLESRSLFQKSSSDGSQFSMHDLLNDLAKLVAGATHFSLREFESEGGHNNTSLSRHASFFSSSHILPERFKIYHGMTRLRSLISLPKRSGHTLRYFLSEKVLSDLLSRLKYLRVLSLSYHEIKEVPDCIGTLRHLRYLDLSETYIAKLPKSIVALYNLEVLILQGCRMLIELPKDMEKLVNLTFLDIADTPKLRAMPLNIGNLVGLGMLSKFVVGTENGSTLKELKNLKNLGEELFISDLHKVRDVGDAEDANLLTKEGICQLNMQWSEDFENSRHGELEGKVLNFLRPHQNLANLEISYYGGLEFPSWFRSPPYVKIVHLRLHGCRRVEALPSLGQLPSLKKLYIEGLDAIRTVGSEFYGNKSPFPSLIILEFKDMLLWEDWSHRVGIEEGGVLFPRLEHLVISNCPRLIGRLPSQLSSLIKLELNSCPHASPSIVSLPSLNELNFGGCNEGVLQSLVDLTSLTALVINNVVELTYLNHAFTSSLSKLVKLEMRSCENLIQLWQDGDVTQNLSCLKSLLIANCSEFRSFVTGEGDMELPGNLETIVLWNCSNLEKLSSKMHTLSSLRELTIEGCPKLMSFPDTGISTSVISLRISGCEMLGSLPIRSIVHLDEPSNSSSRHIHYDMAFCLQELTIFECNSLPASPFSEGRSLPATLRRLAIGWCREVESLAEINLDRLQSLQAISIVFCVNLISLPQCLHTLSHLTSLELVHCPALELECFPSLPPSISSFCLDGCPKIKSLPNQLHRLACLDHLELSECDGITRFSNEGLPPQLRRLDVRKCWNMKQPVREWLKPLTSLQELEIDGSVGGVGEEEDLLLPLPSSLLELVIHNMEDVKKWSGSLPPSLQCLRIFSCPELEELPIEDGLPPSLELLVIVDCWILLEKCKKDTGCYWPHICEIPRVSLIDSRRFFS